jgi:chromosome segregation ATPase
MTRIVSLWAMAAALGLAQGAAAQNDAVRAAPAANSLTGLEQSAQQKAAAWDMLAQGLEAKIARMLPCDRRITASINEVNVASDARLAALAAYLNAEEQQAAANVDAARRVLDSVEALTNGLAAEKADVSQEQEGIEGQLTDLAASVQTRPSLEDAHRALEQLADLVRKRAGLVQADSEGQDALAAALRNLVTALEARHAALRDVLAAYQAEGMGWDSYYAARLARAQTECTITGGVTDQPAGQSKGKAQ